MRLSFPSQCAVASRARASYTSAGFANGVFSFERDELSLISNRSGKASRASATAPPTLSMLTGVSSSRRPFLLSTPVSPSMPASPNTRAGRNDPIA